MIDLMKPIRHRATRKPVDAEIVFRKVEVITAVQVSGMTKYPLVFTSEEFERNYENIPEPREWTIYPLLGDRWTTDGSVGGVRVREILD